MQNNNSNRGLPPPSSHINYKQKIDNNPANSRIKSTKGERLTPKRDSFQQAAVKQVLVSNSHGDGLWCYQTDNQQQAKQIQNITNQNKTESTINPEIQKKSEYIINKKQKILDQQMESEIIAILEKECGDLGIEVEQYAAKIQNQNILIGSLNQHIQQLNEKIKQQENEIEKCKNMKLQQDSQIESIKDLYNKSKREFAGLNNQLENIQQQNNNYIQQIDDNTDQQFSQELDTLRERVDELEEENDELKNRLQIRGDIEKRMDAQRSKQLNDLKHNKISENERKLEKMSKLLEENSTLSEKLAESEILRKKFMEKNQGAEKEMKQLVDINTDLQKQVIQLKKRVNDLTILKQTNHKILEEKISQLNQQVDQTTKENEKLKKVFQKNKKLKQFNQQQGFSDDDDEQLEEVEAKPQLFGA